MASYHAPHPRQFELLDGWIGKCRECKQRTYIAKASPLRMEDCKGCVNTSCWSCRGPKSFKGLQRAIEAQAQK